VLDPEDSICERSTIVLYKNGMVVNSALHISMNVAFFILRERGRETHFFCSEELFWVFESVSRMYGKQSVREKGIVSASKRMAFQKMILARNCKNLKKSKKSKANKKFRLMDRVQKKAGQGTWV
jgi:hypothetical protein